MLDSVALLGNQIQKEKREVFNTKSIGNDNRGGNENQALQRKVEELQDRIRELESNRTTRKEQVNRVSFEHL